MITTSGRASAVLCSFLKSRVFSKPFLLPANACPVVPLTFLKAGVDFEFVDIDKTHAMSQELAKDRIASGKYSGIVFIHAYGKQFDNSAFYRELKECDSQICIIDDRCLCPPTLTDEMPNHTDLVLYSTGYAKYAELLSGGYGITHTELVDSSEYEYSEAAEDKQQEYLKECLKDGKVYEFPADYPWLSNAKLEMSLDTYFSKIRSIMVDVCHHKERINQIYRTLLPKSIQWGEEYDNWRFMVSVKNRNNVLDAIFENNMFAGANYPSVSYLFKKQSSPRAEEEAEHTLNLLNNHRVDEHFAVRICEVINSNI